MSNDQEEPLISQHSDDIDFLYSTGRRPRSSWVLDRLRFFSANNTEHENDEQSGQTTSMSRNPLRLFSVFAILTLLILSFILGYHAAKKGDRDHPDIFEQPITAPAKDEAHRWQSCGSTPTEAVARGCSFDTLSFAWQTPECYDAELMAEWESTVRSNGWQYYADKAGKRPVPYETAFRGTYNLWVEWDLHIMHCTYMWRQMHRAFALTGFIDSHLSSYNHTLHCQKVLIEEHKGWLADTAARLRYPRCERVGV